MMAVFVSLRMSLEAILLISTLFYVNEPIAVMREKAAHDSEVVSQALFSEQVAILDSFAEWSKIETDDGYTGWTLTQALTATSAPYESDTKTSRLSAHIYSMKDTVFGPIKTLPYGSKVKVIEDADVRWLKIALPDGHECYIQRGDVVPEPVLERKGDLVEFSKKFLNLPYTWGGRSSFGFDCSGFVQMLYKKIGINLQRDSGLQINDNRFVTVEKEQLEPGDLIFFGKSKEKIIHVGMSIGEGYFIHSVVRENKPWLRISHLSDLEWSGVTSPNFPYREFKQLK